MAASGIVGEVCSHTPHWFFSFSVSVQLLGGQHKGTPQARVLHINPAAPIGTATIRLLHKGKPVHHLPVVEVHHVGYDTAEPCLLLVTSKAGSRMLVDFQTQQDNTLFRRALAASTSGCFDMGWFNMALLKEGIAYSKQAAWCGGFNTRHAVLYAQRLLLLDSPTSAYPRHVLNLACIDLPAAPTRWEDTPKCLRLTGPAGKVFRLLLGSTREQAHAWLQALHEAARICPEAGPQQLQCAQLPQPQPCSLPLANTQQQQQAPQEHVTSPRISLQQQQEQQEQQQQSWQGPQLQKSLQALQPQQRYAMPPTPSSVQRLPQQQKDVSSTVHWRQEDVPSTVQRQPKDLSSTVHWHQKDQHSLPASLQMPLQQQQDVSPSLVQQVQQYNDSDLQPVQDQAPFMPQTAFAAAPTVAFVSAAARMPSSKTSTRSMAELGALGCRQRHSYSSTECASPENHADVREPASPERCASMPGSLRTQSATTIPSPTSHPPSSNTIPTHKSHSSPKATFFTHNSLPSTKLTIPIPIHDPSSKLWPGRTQLQAVEASLQQAEQQLAAIIKSKQQADTEQPRPGCLLSLQLQQPAVSTGAMHLSTDMVSRLGGKADHQDTPTASSKVQRQRVASGLGTDPPKVQRQIVPAGMCADSLHITQTRQQLWPQHAQRGSDSSCGGTVTLVPTQGTGYHLGDTQTAVQRQTRYACHDSCSSRQAACQVRENQCHGDCGSQRQWCKDQHRRDGVAWHVGEGQRTCQRECGAQRQDGGHRQKWEGQCQRDSERRSVTENWRSSGIGCEAAALDACHSSSSIDSAKFSSGSFSFKTDTPSGTGGQLSRQQCGNNDSCTDRNNSGPSGNSRHSTRQHHGSCTDMSSSRQQQHSQVFYSDEQTHSKGIGSSGPLHLPNGPQQSTAGIHVPGLHGIMPSPQPSFTPALQTSDIHRAQQPQAKAMSTKATSPREQPQAKDMMTRTTSPREQQQTEIQQQIDLGKAQFRRACSPPTLGEAATATILQAAQQARESARLAISNVLAAFPASIDQEAMSRCPQPTVCDHQHMHQHARGYGISGGALVTASLTHCSSPPRHVAAPCFSPRLTAALCPSPWQLTRHEGQHMCAPVKYEGTVTRVPFSHDAPHAHVAVSHVYSQGSAAKPTRDIHSKIVGGGARSVGPQARALRTMLRGISSGDISTTDALRGLSGRARYAADN